MAPELPLIPVERHAARALLISEDGRVLLFAAAVPHRPEKTLWLAPGGGLEAGESHEDAVRREVFEETGLRDFELGPCVWFRRHVWRWGDVSYDQRERFFVARCSEFTPSRANFEPHEVELIGEHRWWAAVEIGASKDWFVPRGLSALLPDVIEGSYPDEPFDCGT